MANGQPNDGDKPDCDCHAIPHMFFPMSLQIKSNASNYYPRFTKHKFKVSF